MNFTAIVDRLDDWLNPIVVKELRQAVKSRMVVSILLLFLGLQLFILGFILLAQGVRGDANTVDWNAGAQVFQIQQGILLWTIMILVPAYAAVRLGNERADQNVDLMFISSLRPASIVWGKFFAAMVLGMLIFSACAPFMTFCYLLRGIDIPTIVAVLAIDLLAMTFGISVALFLASLPGTRPVKFAFSFIGFMQLVWICTLVTGMTVAIIWEGGFFEWLTEQWYVAVLVVLGVLGFCGLLFFYCVALISPPSANRILPLRVYLFAAWAVILVGVFITSYKISVSMAPVPIVLFLALMGPLLAVQLWISICERERWAPRVARTIPRSTLWRVPAFFFYTGSAGGILFSSLLIVITLCAAGWWFDYLGGSGGPWDFSQNFLRACILIAAYLYCYGLSAVLVRTHLLANQLKLSMTWLIALLLVGLGSAIPAVIAFIVLYNDPSYYNRGDPGWWSLPNPFVAVYDLLSNSRWGGREEFEQMCFWFTATWAVLVSVLCLPWIMRQVRLFRPLERRDADPLPVVLAEEPPRAAVSPDAIAASLPGRG